MYGTAPARAAALWAPDPLPPAAWSDCMLHAYYIYIYIYIGM